jgi:pimeloyl-ACP methyl ester carboxylesterase
MAARASTVVRSPIAQSARGLILSLVLVLLMTVVAPARPARAAVGEYEGVLDNGATWRAVVPDDWNGTLLLYSHGYVPTFVPIPNDAQVAPNADTEAALLDEGYALAGSSYAAAGWALDTAAQDQLDTLHAAVATIGVQPRRVLAVGTSMGGLVTGQLAETAGDVVDGALPTCGLMQGGVDLNNYQLDGEHAIDQLLAPDRDIQLVDYANVSEAFAAVDALTAAVERAQQTPQGRARVALAAALFHAPDWRPGAEEPAPRDVDARQQAQYEYLLEMLGFVVPARVDIETTAGGNASWNAGVNYRALLLRSVDRAGIVALYRDAGLDLRADLDRLTATAEVAPDQDALRELRRTSTLSGDLQVPVLSIHTTDDQLAPVQVQEEYAEDVRRAGERRLLRQAYVARPGHCAFTPAELVTAVQVLERRVHTGRWRATTPWALNRKAARLELGDTAFVPYWPGEFLADRLWASD